MKKKICLFAFLSLAIACVSANATRYRANMDTVIDNYTGFEWQKKEQKPRVQADAVKYCAGLVLDGKKDWRLPTVKELSTLFNRSVFYSDLTWKDWYRGATNCWSSSPAVGFPGKVWVADFTQSNVETRDVAAREYVRCVRGGR